MQLFFPDQLLLLPVATASSFPLLCLLSAKARAQFTSRNPFFSPSTLLRGECLGHVESLDNDLAYSVSEDPTPVHIDAIDSSTVTPNQDSHAVFSRSIDASLSAPQRDQLVALLECFGPSFDFPDTSIGRTSVVTHCIVTGTHAPLR
uniref:Putative secreted protein n=1 Tax=Amblyomma parvum TaxID=251391 RepID=A0A023FZA6_AMBPA